jgi:Meiotically up-regulated gene 113
MSALRKLGASDCAFTAEPIEPSPANPFGRKPQHTEKRLDRRHVYFIQPVDGGLIKIGVADDPHGRLAVLQRMCPVALEIVGLIPNAGQAVETELHRRFAYARMHGEWFVPLSGLLDYIAEHASSPQARPSWWRAEW